MSEQEFPLTDYEYGWLVALLEGEGTFGYTKNTQTLHIKMCDKDVMLKLNAIFAKIFGQEFHMHTHLPPGQYDNEIWGISIYGENAGYIMKSVVRHMGYRRRQQIYRALNEWTCPKKTDLKLIMGNRS